MIDLVQGYFIQRTVLDVLELLPNYKIPESINDQPGKGATIFL